MNESLKPIIDGVEKILALEPRSRILDMLCGSGLQTLELCRRNYRVLGLDAAHEFFSDARVLARDENLNAHFLKADIRQIPYRHEFDAVVSLDASFSRVLVEREAIRALESTRKSLKPGGKLLLDLINKEWLMRRIDENLAFDFETGCLESRWSFIVDNNHIPQGHLRVYTLTEIKKLLLATGFTYSGAWGEFDGSSYGLESPRLIVLARKTADPQPRRRPDDDLPSALRIKGRSKGRS